MKNLSLKLISFYRYIISPMLGHTCRYTPSCSNYTMEAIQRFGFFKGWYLGIKRILRCNPWGGCGIDNVPDEFHWFRQTEQK